MQAGRAIDPEPNGLESKVVLGPTCNMQTTLSTVVSCLSVVLVTISADILQLTRHACPDGVLETRTLLNSSISQIDRVTPNSVLPSCATTSIDPRIPGGQEPEALSCHCFVLIIMLVRI
jgi:hypothetical protein